MTAPRPIPNTDDRILELLAERGPMTVDQLAVELKLGQVSIRGSVERLRLRGAVRIAAVSRPGVADVWEAVPSK